jgi:Methyltransferase domain
MLRRRVVLCVLASVFLIVAVVYMLLDEKEYEQFVVKPYEDLPGFEPIANDTLSNVARENAAAPAAAAEPELHATETSHIAAVQESRQQSCSQLYARSTKRWQDKACDTARSFKKLNINATRGKTSFDQWEPTYTCEEEDRVGVSNTNVLAISLQMYIYTIASLSVVIVHTPNAVLAHINCSNGCANIHCLCLCTSQIPYYGDGPKFVCGLAFLRNKTDCLVYSIGSNQEDGFERGVLKVAPNCEVKYCACMQCILCMC